MDERPYELLQHWRSGDESAARRFSPLFLAIARLGANTAAAAIGVAAGMPIVELRLQGYTLDEIAGAVHRANAQCGTMEQVKQYPENRLNECNRL